MRRRTPRPSESTRSAGARAERRARRRYVVRGYRVLAANVFAGPNELDLVLRRGRTLVFCEVKAKAGDGAGDPLEMVDGEKQRRVRGAAERWLSAHPELTDLAVRFDVVAVRGNRAELVPDAF